MDIQKLADEAQIGTSYIDVTGKEVVISPECREDTLRLMGWPLDDEHAVAELKKRREQKQCDDMLEAVTVLNDDDFPFIYIKTRADIRETAVITTMLELEDGARISEARPLEEIEIASYFFIEGLKKDSRDAVRSASQRAKDEDSSAGVKTDGKSSSSQNPLVEYDNRRLILSQGVLSGIPYGYHHFSCVVTDGYRIFNSRRMLLIRAPSKTYMPESLIKEDSLERIKAELIKQQVPLQASEKSSDEYRSIQALKEETALQNGSSEDASDVRASDRISKSSLKKDPLKKSDLACRNYSPEHNEVSGDFASVKIADKLDLNTDTRKVWGVSIQLYALRSKKNWGIGDFEDLKDLLPEIAKKGGHFVGLNPLHAGYPASPDPSNCSPYSPSSRLFLNIAYISVPSVPEYLSCKEACAEVASEEFKRKVKALREREYVDWHGVLELKLKVLRLIFRHMHVDDRRSNRGRKFLSFIEQGGDSLMNMATYGAIQEELFNQGIDASGWQAFPRELSHCNSPFVEVWRNEHSELVRFYCYLQFLAQEQLDAAFEKGREAHMAVGIYRDLAVGVSAGSCDVWGDLDRIYRTEASVGAPPDPLGPQGQVWGLVPMDPVALKDTAYDAMIKLYRSNMQSCGALRIDHAAGLNRLWWVRDGHKASEGAYVKSNMHDLLGIICLESHRNHCMIIAEDLGTIPQDLRDALSKCGALSYKIFLYERAGDGGFIAPDDYPRTAMAALTTHDMPTLKGWWNCLDLKEGIRMGIYTKEQSEALEKDRENAKKRMFDSMRYFNTLLPGVDHDPEKVEFSDDLVLSMQQHFCSTNALLCSSQLEDWCQVEKPVNVPGTMREYPNWSRKLNKDLDEIFSDVRVKRLTAAMTKAREG